MTSAKITFVSLCTIAMMVAPGVAADAPRPVRDDLQNLANAIGNYVPDPASDPYDVITRLIFDNLPNGDGIICLGGREQTLPVGADVTEYVIETANVALLQNSATAIVGTVLERPAAGTITVKTVTIQHAITGSECHVDDSAEAEGAPYLEVVFLPGNGIVDLRGANGIRDWPTWIGP